MDPQENKLFAAIIIAILVIGAVITYFIISVIQHQKKVLLMERENANAEVNALEKDRERIANDLHDDLAPMLSAIKMKINSFDLHHSDDQFQLEKTNSAIDEIAKRMRTISFDLMPASLKTKGLFTAVKEFATYISQKGSLDIQLNVPDKPLFFDDRKVIHVYRIFQEIIQNTIKHSRAKKLVVELRIERDILYLVSVDDGVGFQLSEKSKDNPGLGLKSLNNRVTLLKGQVNRDSTIGKGTTYIVEIPLENA